MPRCRAESFYLSPRDKRSFSQWRVHTRVGGVLVEITHRGDLARLSADPTWDHVVTLTAREGSAQETHWLDERVVEGHLPRAAEDRALWEVAQTSPPSPSARVTPEEATRDAPPRRRRRRGRGGDTPARTASAPAVTAPGAARGAPDTPTLRGLRTHPVICSLGDAFARRGHTLYLVGGTVRDAFADELGDDLDFTTDASPEVVKGIVGTIGTIWDANGEQYGTVGVDVQGFKVEITQHRREVYTADSRNPVVALGGTLLDDLGRRDFTFNASAMACHTPEKEVVDPHDGAGAFAAGVIDVPGDDPLSTMSEDPLRCVRAARFRAKFEMEIAERVREAIADPEVVERLERIISAERKTTELMKTVRAGGETAALFLDTCAELGIARAVLRDIPARPERTRAIHALGPSASPDVILATLVVGEERAAQKLAALKNIKSQQIKQVCRVAEVAESLTTRRTETSEVSLHHARALVLDHDDATLADALQVAGVVDPHSAHETRALIHAAQTEHPSVRAGLPVEGEDALALGLRGPAVGRGLRAVREAFLANPSLSADDARSILAATGAATPPPPTRR